MATTILPRHKENTDQLGVVLSYGNCIKSGLLNICLQIAMYYELKSEICKSSQHNHMMVPLDYMELIRIPAFYRDLLIVVSNAKMKIFSLIWSIVMKLFWSQFIIYFMGEEHFRINEMIAVEIPCSRDELCTDEWSVVKYSEAVFLQS
jgi:hypothetical protein